MNTEKRIHRASQWQKYLFFVLLALTVAAAAFKYVWYFLPERIDFDSRARAVSEVNPDVESLQVMPFNGELTVACQPMLLVNSNDQSMEFDFVSAPTNRVLVRAEVYTDVENLKQKPFKRFWTRLLYPKDQRLVRIADTGWVRAGEMIETIKLDEIPWRSGEVTVRFSAVNPANTKISGGMFSMQTNLFVVDYSGNVLDENGTWVTLEQ